MNYFVLDLETASAASSSICEIGTLEVRGNGMAETHDFVVAPPLPLRALEHQNSRHPP